MDRKIKFTQPPGLNQLCVVLGDLMGFRDASRDFPFKSEASSHKLDKKKESKVRLKLQLKLSKSASRFVPGGLNLGGGGGGGSKFTRTPGRVLKVFFLSNQCVHLASIRRSEPVCS